MGFHKSSGGLPGFLAHEFHEAAGDGQAGRWVEVGAAAERSAMAEPSVGKAPGRIRRVEVETDMGGSGARRVYVARLEHEEAA